jgi:uncharacterized protein YjiK
MGLLCWPLWVSAQYPMPYRLDKPDRRVVLSEALKELSGLAMSSKPKEIMAIQDELGRVYMLDKKTFQIVDTIDFAGDGDFEDLTLVNDTIYVIKSSGVLYRISHGSGSAYRTEKFKTGLSRNYDLEGLAYDQANKRLLVACKSLPAHLSTEEKHVYAIPTSTMVLDTAPLIRMVKSDWLHFLENQANRADLDKLISLLQQPDKQGGFRFSPSGIAVHPQSGNYYMLSAVGHLLAVVTPEGAPAGLYRLDKRLLEQPEAICFDLCGTLYIGSEGKQGGAVVVQYRMRSTNKTGRQ